MAEGVEVYRTWTVEQLKDFLRHRRIHLTGNKEELVEKVHDIVQTDSLEAELEAVSFQRVDFPAPPGFTELPNESWIEDDFPLVTESRVTSYLKAKQGYTKNFRTGIRLCQCGHVFSLEIASSGNFNYVKAKCRPTMRKVPQFYSLFIKLDSSSGTLIGGNCECPAGESQSCVHVAALLITLLEVTPQACTSMRCAWSRPAQGGKACLAATLDFGRSSSSGYFAYDGPVLPVDDLLQKLDDAGCDSGVKQYFDQERERGQHTHPPSSANPVLIDPLDKLCEISASRDVTVQDLVEALRPTKEDVELIQSMSIGQRNNPIWMDARQWRVTSSNFGKVCNRSFKQLYPISLIKFILGDYGAFNTAALQWGCDHESEAIQLYMNLTGIHVDDCGVFLSEEYPHLATSPDGVIRLTNEEFAVIEVKCPYKHRDHSIADSCEDAAFCLYVDESGLHQLKRTHDYYYQITGQLALTGAQFCDLVVWTNLEIHVERIFLDNELWTEMVGKLNHFYYTSLGIEILDRLCNM